MKNRQFDDEPDDLERLRKAYVSQVYPGDLGQVAQSEQQRTSNRFGAENSNVEWNSDDHGFWTQRPEASTGRRYSVLAGLALMLLLVLSFPAFWFSSELRQMVWGDRDHQSNPAGSITIDSSDAGPVKSLANNSNSNSDRSSGEFRDLLRSRVSRKSSRWRRQRLLSRLRQRKGGGMMSLAQSNQLRLADWKSIPTTWMTTSRNRNPLSSSESRLDAVAKLNWPTIGPRSFGPVFSFVRNSARPSQTQTAATQPQVPINKSPQLNRRRSLTSIARVTLGHAHFRNASSFRDRGRGKRRPIRNSVGDSAIFNIEAVSNSTTSRRAQLRPRSERSLRSASLGTRFSNSRTLGISNLSDTWRSTDAG